MQRYVVNKECEEIEREGELDKKEIEREGEQEGDIMDKNNTW